MATVTKYVCPQCNRVNTSRPGRGCREAPDGQYCVQWGLKWDWQKLAGSYSPDPVLKHEQQAIDEYAPRLAEAELLVDAALKVFDAANRAWADLITEARRQQYEADHAQQYMDARSGSIFSRPKKQEPVTGGQISEALEERRGAEAQLQGVRSKLASTEQRADRARQRGRAVDRGQAAVEEG